MGLLIYWLQIISYIFNVCRVRKILSYAIITTGGSDAETSACMSYSRGDWSLCPAVGTTHPLCVEHARAGEIQRIEGISARLLAERLRLLEQQGFVYRNYEQTIPPTVTYGITHRMKDIERVLGELERVARKWGEPVTAAPGKERSLPTAK